MHQNIVGEHAQSHQLRDQQYTVNKAIKVLEKELIALEALEMDPDEKKAKKAEIIDDLKTLKTTASDSQEARPPRIFETVGCDKCGSARFWKVWLRNSTYLITLCGFGGLGALACAILFGMYGFTNPDLIANNQLHCYATERGVDDVKQGDEGALDVTDYYTLFFKRSCYVYSASFLISIPCFQYLWVQRGLNKPNSKVLIPQLIMLLNMMVHVALWCWFGFTYDSNYGDVCHGIFAKVTGEKIGGPESPYLPITANFLGIYGNILLGVGIAFFIFSFIDLTLLCKFAQCCQKKNAKTAEQKMTLANKVAFRSTNVDLLKTDAMEDAN